MAGKAIPRPAWEPVLMTPHDGAHVGRIKQAITWAARSFRHYRDAEDEAGEAQAYENMCFWLDALEAKYT